jgi:hypothetical protein
MKKRIKHQMDPKKIERFKQAMAVAKEILLEIVADATTDVSSSGQNMGTEGGWVYVQRGYNAAEKFPKLYDPEELSLENYKRSIDLAQFAIHARQDAQSLNEWASFICIETGKDLMDDTNHIRQRAQAKRIVNPEYAKISDDLNLLFEKRSEKAFETRKTNKTIKDLKGQIK